MEEGVLKDDDVTVKVKFLGLCEESMLTWQSSDEMLVCSESLHPICTMYLYDAGFSKEYTGYSS